jgi:hypothetical protein
MKPRGSSQLFSGPGPGGALEEKTKPLQREKQDAPMRRQWTTPFPSL